MKVHHAFTLLVPLVSLSARAIPFASAKTINLCAEMFDGGYGGGRVHMTTLQAACTGPQSLVVDCHYVLPTPEGSVLGYKNCELDERCVPVDTKPNEFPDAGCQKELKPSGVKGNRDNDGFACSAGVEVGSQPVVVMSWITADNPKFQDYLTRCTITKSGQINNIYVSSPCAKKSVLLHLAAHTTYQACISTAIAVARVSVGFHWHIDSPGKTKKIIHTRDEHEKPLREMFTIDNSTASEGFSIEFGN
ncbi:hypothetical protein EG327_003980 [Venturia inaequalis]|uniref:Uncharacterized protein n=1 Tax=Venturia inaequalis TaxID=5025 RepID=A0A8H3YIC0_VENIN|nr:hypothetical protein EG327_003980 [Venturia inaequalis]